jgi:hypothetical protein
MKTKLKFLAVLVFITLQMKGFSATPNPIISSKAIITTPDLKNTFLYDISTESGKRYMFIAQ